MLCLKCKILLKAFYFCEKTSKSIKIVLVLKQHSIVVFWSKMAELNISASELEGNK